MPYSLKRLTFAIRRVSRRLSPISSIRWCMVASDGRCFILMYGFKIRIAAEDSYQHGLQDVAVGVFFGWRRVPVHFTVEINGGKHLSGDKEASIRCHPAASERKTEFGNCEINVFFHAHMDVLRRINLHG